MLVPILLLGITLGILFNAMMIKLVYVSGGIIINHNHQMIHEGKQYHEESNSTLGVGDDMTFLFNVTSDKQTHMRISYSTADEAIASLCENPNITTRGTLEEPHNRNRYYADNNTMDIYSGGNLSCAGKEILFFKTLSDYESNEIIFNSNSTYAFAIVNNATGSNNINWLFDWYEND